MNREKWIGCTRCALHKHRRNVVLGRGDLPCDILIIGDAPSKAEDLRAEPFLGGSGKLFEAMLAQAADAVGVDVPSVYITNCCACRPSDSLTGPNLIPTEGQLWACFERLMEEVKAANPRRIILLGKLAQKHCKTVARGAHHMNHPSFILRSGGMRSPFYLKEMRDLSLLIKEVADDKEKEGEEGHKEKRRIHRSKRRYHK